MSPKYLRRKIFQVPQIFFFFYVIPSRARECDAFTNNFRNHDHINEFVRDCVCVSLHISAAQHHVIRAPVGKSAADDFQQHVETKCSRVYFLTQIFAL